MATLHPSHPLAGTITWAGSVVARETRDSVPWLVVEFEGYGTVSGPASDFVEVA